MNRVDLKRYPVTTALLVASIAMYIYTSIRYGLSMGGYEGYLSGAFNAWAVKDCHEYWRLITANFVHFGILHLLCNMISLYNVGPFVESQFKRYEYIMIVVTSMIFTNLWPLFQYAVNGTQGNTVSGGISGVIFGLLGAIVVLGLSYKGYYQQILRNILPSIIFMLLLSLTISSISLSGHLGGMIGGALVTYYIIYMRKKNYN